MITRFRTLVTGLTATVVLAALVAGLPLALYRFGGSPLPRRLPSWHDTVALLASRDGEAVLLAGMKACAWLAWVLLTACILAEAQAAARGHRSPRLRLGGIQGAAARLVALATLAFSAPAAVTLSASVTAVTSQHTLGGRPLAAPPAVNADLISATVPDTGMSARVVTVRAGDCLWSIAARYLGAGDRYPEIARLNYGRQMGNGEVFSNPARIYPGWQLLMPAAAGPAQPAASAPSASESGTATTPGRASAAHGRHPGHPTKDSYYQRRHPVAAAAQVPSQAAPVTAQKASSAGARESDIPAAAVFVTGALAGSVVTSLSRMRFRQRQVRRRGRRIALPPDGAILAAEQRLRAAAGPAEPLRTLRGALACLEAGLLASGQQLPDIVGVHVRPDLLELLLAAPPPEGPPAPYEVSPGRQGMSWQLALPAVAPQAIGPADCHVLPGLITVGATGDGYLLLDLESLQVTGCDGPPDLVGHVITTIATELVTGQWSGWYDLILVGCDELAPVGRAEHCTSLAEALSTVEARCATRTQRVAARGPADVRELRLAEPENEDWALTILVSRAEPSAAELTRLLDLAVDSWGGIAAIVPGDAEAADGRMAPTVLQLAPDPDVTGGIVANVVPLQIRVRPQALSEAEYDAIGTLFAAAADLDDVAPEAAPYAVYGAPPWIPQAAQRQPQQEPDADWPVEPDVADGPVDTDADPAPAPTGDADGYTTGREEPAPYRPGAFVPGPRPFSGIDEPAAAGGPAGGTLDVRILGPLTITGTAGQLQPAQAELVLALALAGPAGLSNSALRSMLGADPDHPKPSDAVRQIITRTRRRLGDASDGRERIIHAGGGQYVLHPDVILDWSRFRELVASGRADDLRAALALVRGQPFTGSYFWWIDIPLIETVRAEITDAADTLAEFELATGSARAAARAARAGLLAEPAAEQLWRAVMRAEHAAGSLAGVAEAWRRCVEAIEDIAPGGEPHPDTAALYRRLMTAAPSHVPAH